MIQIESMVLGEVATNTFFLKNPESDEMILVDPADRVKMIEDKIREMGGKPVAILLTHGHFDHCKVAEELKAEYDCPIICELHEEQVLKEPGLNLSVVYGGDLRITPDQTVRDGEVLALAGYRIEVLHTPGHTSGSCCFYFPDEEVLIAGDTLFQGSCGRVDFPTGDWNLMTGSLKRLVTELPENVRVYPGHNAPTTIGEEKRHNPFVPR